ncbi:PLP-dependent aminotransferase family protein [Actinacidiphila bryophytorum]|uniref:Uncharacterized protein n=1 Tax=Actinacidiphila bryophytorum TaxID=1436133 RepID=A0A9W4H2J1_9ACTN|nr:hypothetical protein [Actinacidiphila bryophytorum]MBM9440620.1 hypothetical protein [Actinacidiphila bryophytorum]CAG7645405.1 hypothetical protein SBRY_40149 [Actinacidiphila bryophytorum]
MTDPARSTPVGFHDGELDVQLQAGVAMDAARLSGMGAGLLCRDAGVPLVLDVCQSLGHVDVTGVGASVYVGTSRKWLAGPRGVGFVISPGLAAGEGTDVAAPSIQSHTWGRPAGSPVAGAARFETSEASVASRVGLACAVLEHLGAQPALASRRLAAMGRRIRHTLHGLGGWTCVEPADEPTAIVTLRPPPGQDPADAVEQAVRTAKSWGLTLGAIPTRRAPDDMSTPVLRVSPPLGASEAEITRLAEVLDV